MSRETVLNRRRVLQSSGALVAAGAMSGCLGDDDTNGDDDDGVTDDTDTDDLDANDWPDLSGQEVHYLTDQSAEPLQDLYDRVAADFEEATGATVNMEYVGFDELTPRTIQLLQAGNPPEVLDNDTYIAADYLRQGAIAPLTDVYESVTEQYGDPPGHTPLEEDGEIYNVPFVNNTVYNWYRSDVVDWTPETWEEQLEWVAEADTEDVRGHYVPVSDTLCPEVTAISIGYTNDALTVGYEDGEFVIIMNEGENRERWLEVIDHLQELGEHGVVATDADCLSMFEAMPLEQSYSAAYVGTRPKDMAIDQNREFAPNMVNEQLASNRSNATFGGVKSFFTFEESNADAGRAYIEFFMQWDYFEEYCLAEPLHNTVVYPEVQERIDWLEEMPDAWTQSDVETIFTVNENSRSVHHETDPPCPYMAPLINQRSHGRMFYDVFANDMSPEEALDKAAGELEDVLSDLQEE